MQVRQYAANNSLNVDNVIQVLKNSGFNKNWSKTSALNEDHKIYLNLQFEISETPALPPQDERKALPQAQPEQPSQPEIQVQTVQTEQTEQLAQPQQEDRTVNDTTSQIQTTNNDLPLTKSDLAAIATIRETFGEQGVQVFLQKKRQELIVNKATVDALRQHDEQELYEETKLQVQNQLQIRDYIKEQQALEMAITQHSQIKAQRKEQIQKSNEIFDIQLSELLTKQQNFNATIELLGISMI